MKNNLRKELLQQGASKNEAENLARLAAQLNKATPRGLSARAKQRMYEELPMSEPKERRPALRWTFAGSLAGAMALLVIITQLVIPGMHAKPNSSDTQTLVQPTESTLQQLDTKIQELQQQPDVNQVQLKQTEDQYKRTLDNFKKKYQSNKQFQNYDWNKWQRKFTTQSYQKNTTDTHVNGASTTSDDNTSWNQTDENRR